MRAIGFAAVLLTLAGCEDGSRTSREEPSASVSGSPTPVQTSIIRPEVAPPEPTPTAIRPLKVVIGFPEGGSTIAATETEKLKRLIASPQLAAGGSIRIGAHSDSTGGDSDNLTASRKRGEAVLAWLRDYGINEDRMRLVAFGEQNPAQPNARPDGSPDEAGRRANRRVEITVTGAAVPKSEVRKPTLAEEMVDDEAMR